MLRIAGIATIDGRQISLCDTIKSLLPQVDEIHIHNGNDKGDRVKFDSYRKDCYYFSCDDDLIYPKDYCDKMIATYEYMRSLKYDNPIVTCHGRNFIQPIDNYYRNGVKYHCLHEVEQDVKVDCGGTGVMMLCGQIDMPDFTERNMADIFIALQAKKQNVPIICMKHEAGWIKHSDKIDLSETIYEWHKNDCEAQTKLINTVQW
jgi:hypothetical protein